MSSTKKISAKKIFVTLVTFFLLFIVILLISSFILLSSNFYNDIPLEKLKEKYANDQSKFMMVDSLQIHYRDEGKGIPLVLLHGTAASLHTWDGWTGFLKDSFRIIRLDLPAFGLTGPNPSRDYSIEAYSKVLDDFLEKLNVTSFYLAGNSLGGHIAWDYTTRHPDKVLKLILLAPSGLKPQQIEGKKKERPLAFRLAANPSLRWLVRHLTPKHLIRHSLLEVYADDNKVTQELVKQYHDMLLREGNREAFIDRTQQPKGKDRSALLKNLKLPVLLQWGEGDEWISPTLAPHFANLLSNSKTIIYKQTGHVPMEEEPSKTVKDAFDFLATPIIQPLSVKIPLLKR